MDLNEKNAIQLKYQGYKYERIAKLLNIEYDTIVSWFRTDGKLFEDYNNYEHDHNKMIDDMANNLLKKNLNNACEVLINEMNDMKNAPQIRIKAACEVLNRIWGVKPDINQNKKNDDLKNFFDEISIYDNRDLP